MFKSISVYRSHVEKEFIIDVGVAHPQLYESFHDLHNITVGGLLTLTQEDVDQLLGDRVQDFSFSWLRNPLTRDGMDQLH